MELLPPIRVVLTLLLLRGALCAQPGNDTLVAHLLTAFVQEQGPFRDTSGTGAVYLGPFVPDTSADQRLVLHEPGVVYRRLEGNHYLRLLSVQVEWGDSLLQSKTLLYADTLELELLRRLRRSSPIDLQGDPPGQATRWLVPLLISGGSTALVVVLFFLRSPR
ncbi:MAG: hypothetical protein OHK0039_12250 [Bacteroidia bacterium]